MEGIHTKQLDHLGLVASTIKRTNLIKKIDKLIPLSEEKGACLSMGERVAGLILNGLGFLNTRLYMVADFLDGKPVDRLIGPGVTAEQFNDDSLGRCLDAIHQYGSTQLYASLALSIGAEQGVLGKTLRHDSTTISVYGKYTEKAVVEGLKKAQGEDQNEQNKLSQGEVGTLSSDNRGTCENVMRITYGYSKDHRPDLKQFTLGISTTGQAGFPLWFEGLSGNASDKTTFHESAAKIRSFLEDMRDTPTFMMIFDAAFYQRCKLSAYQGQMWMSRVPETIKEAKQWLEIDFEQKDWVDLESSSLGEYLFFPIESDFGGVKQRWQMVLSKQAQKAEIITFEKRLKQTQEELQKGGESIGKEVFKCKKDAHNAFHRFAKTCKTDKFYKPVHQLEEVTQYASKGRPKKGDQPLKVGYHLRISWESDEGAQKRARNRLGRFIIATNQLDKNELPNECLLSEYKSLQQTERGFRFLKDSSFHASSVFLKKPERIQALMMVMTLCLMIYNLSDYLLRQRLKQENTTLPNQVKKPVTNPTFRWISHMMQGIVVVYLSGHDGMRETVVNLSEVTCKVIRLFGKEAEEIYGL